MTTSGTGNLIPSTPVANLGLNYVNGMNLSYLTTTTFSVAAGQCRDSSNTFDIVMGANTYANSVAVSGSPATSVAVTVSISRTGAGGLDTGTVAASTMYNVFAIGSSTGNASGSVVISTASRTTGPSLPLNYDCWRYIGSVSTDGSSVLRPFTQTGSSLNRTMRYQVPVAPGSAATSGSATYASIGVLGTLTPAAQLDVILGVSMDSNTAGNILYLAPYGNVALASSGLQAKLSSSVTTAPQHGVLVCPQVSNSGTYQILYATTEASDAVTFLVIGYVDVL